MIEDYIERLEQRVLNLEVALHGLWAMLKPLQPLAVQQDIDNMLKEHFEVSGSIGGFRRGSFEAG